MKVNVHTGDSRELLKALAASSIDSVVTDPPYALVSIAKRFATVSARDIAVARANPHRRTSSGFMGQKWDTGDVAHDPAFWAEVLRVMKPGAHLVAFAGTRTYHRLACAIEDAGFEIRDQIAWLYGSGFPKSHDVSKGIDRAAGVIRDIVGQKYYGKEDFERSPMVRQAPRGTLAVTVPATPDAIRWNGWGTALKPALEPIVLARKPINGTVADNVLEHGTGAINVDGCRVATDELVSGVHHRGPDNVLKSGLNGSFNYDGSKGRWPANVIHDGSDEVVDGFPNSDSTRSEVTSKPGSIYANGNGLPAYTGVYGFDDSGSAARFFYTAKADAIERIGSKHPTVKPVDLMRYLCRLVTPPRGVILDPFAGTGTTGEAAILEGFKAVLIEREPVYVKDIMRRLSLAYASRRQKLQEIVDAKGKRQTVDDLPLFGGPLESMEAS